MIKNTKYMLLAYGLLYIFIFALPLSEAIKNISVWLLILVLIFNLQVDIFLKLDIISKSVLFVFVTIIVSTIYSIDLNHSIAGLMDVVAMLLLFIIIRHIDLNNRVEKYLVPFLLIGFLVTLSIGYYNYFILNSQFLELKSVGHVNHSSIYMLLIYCISISYAVFGQFDQNYKKFIFIIVILIFSLISIFITGSRATMYTSIVITLLLVCYCVLNTKNLKIVLWFFALFVLILFTIFVFSNNYILEKFTRGLEDNARIGIVMAFLSSWLDGNILFGIGLNNSSLIDLNNYGYFDRQHYSHAHNTFVTFLVERGLFGLIAYLGFMFVVAVKLFQKFYLNRNSWILVASILIWIVNMIISFVNTTFHHENAMLMVVFFGLALNDRYIKKT